MATLTISLQVHHISRDLHFLNRSFSVEPDFCLSAGQTVGNVLRRTSVWHGALFRGIAPANLDRALEELLYFLRRNDETLAQFANDDGLLELIVTHWISATEMRRGEVDSSVNLHPFLLNELASRQIGLKWETAYDAER